MRLFAYIAENKADTDAHFRKNNFVRVAHLNAACSEWRLPADSVEKQRVASAEIGVLN